MSRDGRCGARRREASTTPLLAEINITPFVDVMLVVLVIFMVAAPLMIHGWRSNCPRRRPALGRPAKPLIVSLARDGALGRRRADRRRPSSCGPPAAMRREDGDAVVYVRADRASPMGRSSTSWGARPGRLHPRIVADGAVAGRARAGRNTQKRRSAPPQAPGIEAKRPFLHRHLYPCRREHL